MLPLWQFAQWVSLNVSWKRFQQVLYSIPTLNFQASYLALQQGRSQVKTHMTMKTLRMVILVEGTKYRYCYHRVFLALSSWSPSCFLLSMSYIQNSSSQICFNLEVLWMNFTLNISIIHMQLFATTSLDIIKLTLFRSMINTDNEQEHKKLKYTKA